MTNEAIARKLTKARISLLTSQPFWGTLALRLQLLEMPDAMRASFDARGMKHTLAVDGKRIYYAPEFIDSLTPDLVRSAISHEVGHCMFEHIGRRGDRSPTKWNAAGDYIINAALKNSGFEIGPGWLYNEDWAEMTTDQVYKLLPDDPGHDGNGDGSGKKPLCDIMDGESKSNPTLEEDWKTATAQAAAVAEKAGKLPAHLKRFVDDLLNPKTDWRTQLRRFVTETSKNDYSWQRPNKKMLGAHGVYLPSLYSERMGTIAIAIDTSGSITQPMLNIFASEINAIRNDVHPERTIVIYCDADVNKVVEFTPEDQIELEMVGGGSTSFKPPFKYLRNESITPAAFLYMTDGYGDAPSRPPEYPVMWCMTTKVEMPWGERIQLDMDAE